MIITHHKWGIYLGHSVDIIELMNIRRSIQQSFKRNYNSFSHQQRL